jgi:hypothetical protein
MGIITLTALRLVPVKVQPVLKVLRVLKVHKATPVQQVDPVL